MNDEITVNDSPSLTLGSAATFAAWVNIDTLNSAHRIFVAKRSGGTAEYQFGISSNNKLKLSLVSSGSSCCVDVLEDATVLNTGTWYHVAVTFDDATDTVKWYVNGTNTETETTTLHLGTDTALNLEIGGLINPSEPFDGRLDDVRIYNRVLTNTEITALALLDGTPPTAPAGLTAVANGQRIDLDWLSAADPDSGIAAHRIYRGLAGGGAKSVIDEVAGKQLSYTDGSTAPSTGYCYQVSAKNGAGLEPSV